MSSLAGCQPRALKLEGFEDYLKGVLTSDKDIVHMKSVAKKYCDVLTTGNASELHPLTRDVRRNAMRALAHLAKFNGCYEQWQKIVKANGLKRKQADDNFNFFEKEDITEMLDYVKRIIGQYPGECANAFIVATLTGLRADEACQAIRLIKKGQKATITRNMVSWNTLDSRTFSFGEARRRS